MGKKAGSVYISHDLIAMYAGDGTTVYFSVEEAEKLLSEVSECLATIGDDMRTRKFSDIEDDALRADAIESYEYQLLLVMPETRDAELEIMDDVIKHYLKTPVYSFD